MKRFILFSVLILFFASCSTDDQPYYYREFMPVESVDIPEEFIMGEIYPITVRYYRPTTCYWFETFYYRKDNNIRVVAPINVVGNENCEPLDNVLTEDSFNFLVTSNGSYVFKFWQGEDSNGDDIYLTIEVPVVE
ncbi:hypothetical protein V8G61_13360 [Gaetbulibacter sp. M240]|uniref:hypothetical protein n=1 Tax=Gaetbulibacter sp. M240 TaxID=3126511 RepID=UPI00374F6B58